MKIQTENKIQTSEGLLVGILLALAGGFMEIYSYMARGKVFANAQTGNMVLFGVKIAEGDISGTIYYAVPILAFILGVVLAYYIKKWFVNSSIHWRQIVLAIEAAVLMVVMFVPCGRYDMVVNAAISFVCSVQVQSFRKLKGNVFATTMCTGNLRSATDLFLQYRDTKNKQLLKKSVDYYVIIAMFILGGIVGGIVTKLIGAVSVGFAAIPIIIAIVAMRRG